MANHLEAGAIPEGSNFVDQGHSLGDLTLCHRRRDSLLSQSLELARCLEQPDIHGRSRQMRC